MNPTRRINRRARSLVEALEARALLTVTWSQDATYVYVNNGIVTASIRKSDSSVLDMRLASRPTQNLMDPTRGLYWSLNVTVAGQPTVWTWLSSGNGPTVSVAATPTMVDVKFVNDKMNYDAAALPNGSFSAELHIVLLEGEAGLYTYHVLRHGAGQPQVDLDLDMHQMRVNPIFTSSATNTAWSFTPNERQGKSIGATPTPYTNLLPEVQEFPANSYFTQPTGQLDPEGFPIYDELVGTSDQGLPTWSKYDWHSYMGESTTARTAFGDATDNLGIWFVQGSQEFYNGGPTKGKATVSGNLLYADFTNDHGLGGGGNKTIAADEVYEKLVGPVFIYANAGTGHQNLWNNALARGDAEVARFPNYNWLNVSESLFPKSRGVVSGQLNLPTGPASNAQIILGDSSNLDWQLQGYRNFLFWGKADENGNFSIGKVRPGTYTLYAYVPGTFGEFKKASVVVSANGTTNLGTLLWTPDDRQQSLFQIGTPDRSTGEFKFGDRLRQYGLWWHYLAAEPQMDIDYVVGTSTPAQDWYYAQMIIPTGARTDTSGIYRGSKWNVKFNLTAAQISAMSDTLTLTTALAGSQGSAFYVDVNGTLAVGGTTGQYTHSDPAIYRNAVKRGYAQTFAYSINKTLLVAGTNTLTFRLRAPGGAANDGTAWTGTKPVIPSGGIMWDSIRLESGGKVVGGSPDFYSLDVGTTGVAGTAVAGSATQFTINGAGAGITGTSDSFQFTSRSLDADGAITAKLDSATGGKAGLMLRDGLGKNASFAAVLFTPGAGIVFQSRSGAGTTASTSTTIPLSSGTPYLKIVRVGTTVYGYYSTNGLQWTLAGSRAISGLGSQTQVGMAVTSNSTTVAQSAVFSSVAVSESQTGLPTVLRATHVWDLSPNRLNIDFSEDISPSLSTADIRVTNLTLGAAVPISSYSYNAAANRLTVVLPTTIDNGEYQLELRPVEIADPAGNTFSDVSRTSFFVLAGDVNHDRSVNFTDLLVLAQNYGGTGLGFTQGNVDYSPNGSVDFTDLLVLAQNYGGQLLAGESGNSLLRRNRASALFDQLGAVDLAGSAFALSADSSSRTRTRRAPLPQESLL